MTTASLPTEATQPLSTEAAPTKSTLYNKIVCGIGTPDLDAQVLGLSTGKKAGQPFVAAMQKDGAASGNWLAASIPLTGATAPVSLVDLTVCAGAIATDAVGLGSDGKVYLVGEQTANNTWSAGAGLVTQDTTFIPRTLSSFLLNTTTVLAISSGKVPCIAAYRDENNVWQPGYPLISPIISAFQSVAARPDLGTNGTMHVIGLTSGGHACEVAVASGRGTGKSKWKAGQGYLGNKTKLPSFAQLLLVSGDAAMNFHVIGLGTDGSVWDIDTFSPFADTPKWSGTSTEIVPPKTISGSKIDFFLSGGPGSLTINLVAWAGSTLKVVASFDQAWATSTAEIPVSGTSAHWHIVNNVADTTSSGIFILGLSGLGRVYELAYAKDGIWAAGSTKPISG